MSTVSLVHHRVRDYGEWKQELDLERGLVDSGAAHRLSQLASGNL